MADSLIQKGLCAWIIILLIVFHSVWEGRCSLVLFSLTDIRHFHFARKCLTTRLYFPSVYIVAETTGSCIQNLNHHRFTVLVDRITMICVHFELWFLPHLPSYICEHCRQFHNSSRFGELLVFLCWRLQLICLVIWSSSLLMSVVIAAAYSKMTYWVKILPHCLEDYTLLGWSAAKAHHIYDYKPSSSLADLIALRHSGCLKTYLGIDLTKLGAPAALKSYVEIHSLMLISELC